MPKNEKSDTAVDWDLATWDGARREALRRWAQLPLERVIAALEEMQELSDMLAKSAADATAGSPQAERIALREQPADYQTRSDNDGLQQPDNK